MKVTRSFRIEKSLSELLDKNNLRHGDITFHLESALKDYFKTESKPKPVKEVVPVVDDEDVRFCKWMYERIQNVAPKTKEPNYTTWAKSIRLMREQDNHTLREIGEVFDWANKDSFWCTNILSPAKLRKQFAKLHAAANQTTGDSHGKRKQSLADRAADETRIIQSMLEADSPNQCPMGQDDAALQGQVGQCGGHEAERGQVFDGELLTMVPQNGDFNQ